MGKTVREKHLLPRPLLPARKVLKTIEPKSSKDLQRSMLKLSYFYLRVLRSKRGIATHLSRSRLTGSWSPCILNRALSFTPFLPLLWKLPGSPQEELENSLLHTLPPNLHPAATRTPRVVLCLSVQPALSLWATSICQIPALGRASR